MCSAPTFGHSSLPNFRLETCSVVMFPSLRRLGCLSSIRGAFKETWRARIHNAASMRPPCKSTELRCKHSKFSDCFSPQRSLWIPSTRRLRVFDGIIISAGTGTWILFLLMENQAPSVWERSSQIPKRSFWQHGPGLFFQTLAKTLFPKVCNRLEISHIS